MKEWIEQHQTFEKDFWGDCINTFGEEAKQITYAHYMGLENIRGPRGEWPCFDMKSASVVDIGGGPCSMLLKTINAKNKTVIDPCGFPKWIDARYFAAEIEWIQSPAEHCFVSIKFDEVWIYNTLQHVIDPEAVIKNSFDLLKDSGRIRIFEWIHVPVSIGHPHFLTEIGLSSWLGRGGKVDNIDCNGAVGKAFFGTFLKREQ